MLSLAWPMVLTNLGQVAMTTTDILLLGRLGPYALAAGALGHSLYFIPLIFGMGLMLATSPMMARELGRNPYAIRETRRTVRQGLWIAIIIAIPFWLLLWNAEHFFVAFGQEPELAANAGHFIRALQWSLLPFFGYIVLRSFISALEKPRWAILVVAGAVLFNALANWTLIFGHFGFPALGITGSGLSTSLSNIFMFLGLAFVVSREKQFRRFHVFGYFWRPDWPRFKALLALGLPIAATLAFEVTIFNAAAFMMGLIGTNSLAAHAIAMQLASISFMVPTGIGQAVTIRVGLALGANDRAGITRSGWTGFALGVGFMTLAGLVMILFPEQLVSAFIDRTDQNNFEVMRLGATFVIIAGLFQIVDGAQAVTSGMLRGIQDTKIPMLFAALGYWGIGLPLGSLLAFQFDMAGKGIWIGLLVGLATVAALLMLRWTQRDRLSPPPIIAS